MFINIKHKLELQLIKLLYAEKVKKNKTNLFFVAGGRVLSYLGRSVKTERSLTAVLKYEEFLNVFRKHDN